jgi:DUF1680 family protein
MLRKTVEVALSILGVVEVAQIIQHAVEAVPITRGAAEVVQMHPEIAVAKVKVDLHQRLQHPIKFIQILNLINHIFLYLTVFSLFF